MDIQDVISIYLEDEAAQELYTSRIQGRAANILQLQKITQQYITGDFDLQTLCSRLDSTLKRGENWSATGFGFMVELKKILARRKNI